MNGIWTEKIIRMKYSEDHRAELYFFFYYRQEAILRGEKRKTDK